MYGILKASSFWMAAWTLDHFGDVGFLCVTYLDKPISEPRSCAGTASLSTLLGWSADCSYRGNFF